MFDPYRDAFQKAMPQERYRHQQRRAIARAFVSVAGLVKDRGETAAVRRRLAAVRQQWEAQERASVRDWTDSHGA